ncbi:hypothetical protein JKP88DRAFT_254772 [Tribonema minus]|uniref:BACK domain-containing protein n=1 Tax=Tribonema minus TaxID=303371 RepID=A0A836CJH4_9STRA|nr:hypothetical protein JKP88DRAFT_254772 [Tribonema minus]
MSTPADGASQPATAAHLWENVAYSDVVLTFGAAPAAAPATGDGQVQPLLTSIAAAVSSCNTVAAGSQSGAGGKATREPDQSASDHHDNDAFKSPPGARQLDLHAAILSVHSSVLRARLSRWSGPDRPVRINIELDDEAEVAALEDVMWGMYHGKVPAEDMTVERALLIARTANAHAVEIVLCAATAWLNQQASLAWDDVLRLCDTPATVRDRLDFKNAQAAMLQRAGDLEVAMNDEQLRKQLIELPEAAMVTLLSDDRLAVAAESTIVALAIRWAQHHGWASVPDAVASCVRLRYLDIGFLAGTAHFFPLWTPYAIALLSVGQTSPSAWQHLRKMGSVPQILAKSNELERPKSSISALHFKAVVPINELAVAFSNAVRERGTKDVLPRGGGYFAGYSWYLVPDISAVSMNPCRYTAGVFLFQSKDANGCTTGFCKHKFAVPCIANDQTNTIERAFDDVTHRDSAACGSPNFFGLSLDSDAWDATHFGRWTDDAGNLTFDVRIEV